MHEKEEEMKLKVLMLIVVGILLGFCKVADISYAGEIQQEEIQVDIADIVAGREGFHGKT